MTKPKKEKEEKKVSPLVKEIDDVMVQMDRVRLEARELFRSLRKYGDNSNEYYIALEKFNKEREKLKKEL